MPLARTTPATRPRLPRLHGLVGIAVLAALAGLGVGGFSPEAEVAAEAFAAVRGDLVDAVAGCASGRELVDKGFAEDVDVATRLDSATVVPLLRDGAFRAA